MADVPTVAYQGIPGAYSEQAVLQLFHRLPVTPVPKHSFEECFLAVEAGEVDYALLPYENTLGGSIHANYDLMLQHNLFILAETQLRVRHCLLVLPGVHRADIKRILSHPQALAQCDRYIRRHNWKSEAYHDTAASGQRLLEEQLRDMAAIASSRCAEVLGLQILESGIEDDENNYTRFGLLGPTAAIRTGMGPHKTSILFALNNVPGILFKAMACFSMRDIDLLKIESRPRRLPPGSPTKGLARTPGNVISEVVFYLDILMDAADPRAQNAIRHLKELSPFVRVLGSYPVSQPGEPYQSLVLPDRAPMPPLSPSLTLKIGIVGFGTFGQFLAKAFVRAGHLVYASSRTDYSTVAASMGVVFCTSDSDLVASGLDVIIFCTSILSFEEVLGRFPLDQLSNILAVDVLSVKAHAKTVMTARLPPTCDILCTHPMFGPESGKYGWQHLPFVYEKVRISDAARCQRFIDIFAKEGCRMEEMTCEAHDGFAAGSQFITHATGRMLHQLGIESTPINTKGFESLLTLVETTSKDSMDLFVALYQHNPAAKTQLERLEQALQRVRESLSHAPGGP